MADPVPQPTPIFHITHIDNLPRILECGGLQCKTTMEREGNTYTNIAHVNIQYRRSTTEVPRGPEGTLHDYVPFYFAPRSPMLYSIHRGNVEGYTEGQGPVVHLVTSVEALLAAGVEFVFTDGHATMALSDYYTDPADLQLIDWAIMRARYWADRPEDGDRSRRRQAECLVHDFCPIEQVFSIGVIDDIMRKRVDRILVDAGHNPIAVVRRDWYY